MLTGIGEGSWSLLDFERQDSELILGRLQTWKLPLFDLMVQCPRPLYGFKVQLFVLMGLMGNPIDTIASLMFTLHATQIRLARLEKKDTDGKTESEEAAGAGLAYQRA